MSIDAKQIERSQAVSLLSRFALIFMFFLANFGGRFNAQILNTSDATQKVVTILGFISISLLSALILISIVALAERAFAPLASNYFLSAVVLFIAMIVDVSFLWFIEPLANSWFQLHYASQFRNTPWFAATFLIYPFVLAALFRYERTILTRLNLATSLAQRLAFSQRQLVEEEEKQKGQTARYLHDRVQAELMVLSVQLAAIEKNTVGETKAGLEVIRGRLEKLRRVDLRLIGNTLQPNVRELGLKSTVEDLLEQLDANVNFEVSIDDSQLRSNDQLCLGVYRIVEQAVLNCITHGPAANVKIFVGEGSPGTCQIVVQDDGPGTENVDSKSGFGTVAIDSWVGILNGSKEIRSTTGKGYTLTVTCPI